MSDTSARLGLPYLAAGQMQKHVTLNEALTRLDGLVQCSVTSRSLVTSRASPQTAPSTSCRTMQREGHGPCIRRAV